MSELELLERRVTALEQEVEGEKLVTRHILEQTRRNSDDLAAIKSRLNRHDERFDKLEVQIGALEGRIDRLQTEFSSFRRDFPAMMADTMREVLREQKR